MTMMFLVMLVLAMVSVTYSFGATGEEGLGAGKACVGCTTTCSIYSEGSPSFPCYQGAVDDAVKCYASDPLLPSDSLWTCQTCATLGYPTYLRNDPIYQKMELWGNGSTKKN